MPSPTRPGTPDGVDASPLWAGLDPDWTGWPVDSRRSLIGPSAIPADLVGWWRFGGLTWNTLILACIWVFIAPLTCLPSLFSHWVFGLVDICVREIISGGQRGPNSGLPSLVCLARGGGQRGAGLAPEGPLRGL